MNVSIRAEFQKFIEQQVNSGRFPSPAAVLEAGIERLMLDELDREDLAAIKESRQQIERGEDLDWNEVVARLRTKYVGK
jgi:Arc/MetJ-type ribon-helix-helix transcriptional regulator